MLYLNASGVLQGLLLLVPFLTIKTLCRGIRILWSEGSMQTIHQNHLDKIQRNAPFHCQGRLSNHAFVVVRHH